MLSFYEICQDKGFTKDTSFENISQACIEAYYLPPYPGSLDVRKKKTRVNRELYGGVHAARTALCAELFMELYKKYAPQYVVNAEGQPLTDQDIKLLKLAAVYLHSGNISEMEEDPEAHADNFKRDMKCLGYDEQDIEPFALAIRDKDTQAPKNFITKIIHDASCLEVLQHLPIDDFDKTRLDLFKDLVSTQKFGDFNTELDEIIKNHSETIELMEGSLHLRCEFASCCYKALKEFITNMFLSQAIIMADAKHHKTIDISTIDTNEFTIIDLFNRKNSSVLGRIIQNNVMPYEYKETKAEDSVLNLYRSNKLLVRIVPIEKIDGELKTLIKNQAAMEKANIHDAVSMRRYLAEQKGSSIYTPPGFNWRASTLIGESFPMLLHDTAGVGVLFDSHLESGTMISNFYKKDVRSKRAKQGTFPYFLATTGEKDRGSLEDFVEKLHEENQRRMGFLPDPKAHYYGQTTLKKNEVLGTYQRKSIRGILTKSLETHSLQDALILQAKLGIPLRPIYLYSTQEGLQRLSNEAIFQQLRTFDFDIQSSQLHQLTQNTGETIVKDDLSSTEKQYIQEALEIFTRNDKAIAVSIEQQPISDNQPLKYCFVHPKDSSIQCIGYVKQGSPIIELILADGKKITQKTDLLPKIALQYFQQSTERLATHISKDEIKIALTQLGILDLEVHLVQEITKKINLVVSYRLAVGFDKQKTQAALLQTLGIAKVKLNAPFVLEKFQNQPEKIAFATTEVQKIDHFVETLTLQNLQSTSIQHHSQKEEKSNFYQNRNRFVTWKNKDSPIFKAKQLELPTPENVSLTQEQIKEIEAECLFNYHSANQLMEKTIAYTLLEYTHEQGDVQNPSAGPILKFARQFSLRCLDLYEAYIQVEMDKGIPMLPLSCGFLKNRGFTSEEIMRMGESCVIFEKISSDIYQHLLLEHNQDLQKANESFETFISCLTNKYKRDEWEKTEKKPFLKDIISRYNNLSEVNLIDKVHVVLHKNKKYVTISADLNSIARVFKEKEYKQKASHRERLLMEIRHQIAGNGNGLGALGTNPLAYLNMLKKGEDNNFEAEFRERLYFICKSSRYYQYPYKRSKHY